LKDEEWVLLLGELPSVAKNVVNGRRDARMLWHFNNLIVHVLKAHVRAGMYPNPYPRVVL